MLVDDLATSVLTQITITFYSNNIFSFCLQHLIAKNNTLILIYNMTNFSYLLCDLWDFECDQTSQTSNQKYKKWVLRQKFILNLFDITFAIFYAQNWSNIAKNTWTFVFFLYIYLHQNHNEALWRLQKPKKL